MKKSLITLALVVCTITAFGQGQLNFNTRVGTVILAPVYLPEAGDSLLEKHGNTATGIPAGTQTYTGGVIPASQGAGYSAQLFAGPLGTTDENLTPLTPITTFRTQTALAGFIINVSTIVPGVAANSQARAQMRVWQNLGNTVTSWTDALTRAAGNSTYQLGDGLSFDTPALTALPASPADPIGIQSFNVHTVVPEPSTIALGVLGLGALVLFRRRK